MDRATFLRRVNNPFLLRIFLIWKLPAAWFMGIRVTRCSEQDCVVRLPFGWRSQNPFRSIYFAAQCAAGELSTGLLLLANLQEQPPVSMLVTGIEAVFTKKASEPLLFTCTEGSDAAEIVRQVLETSTAHSIRMTASGCLPDGTEAARVMVTWSLKRKRNLSR